jgi:molybdopterin adenylyltransferase
MEVVPDDHALIEDRLNHLVDDGCDLIFTTGGTGLTPNDITPEATRAVLDREAPGFAEAMRAESLRHTPHGMLTRGISGIAGRTLIVNFPGSPKAIDELFGVLVPVLPHVVRTLHGDSSHHDEHKHAG